MMRTELPRSGSYIAHLPLGTREIFERADALMIIHAGYRVETIESYLGRINREIREGAS